MVSFQTLSEKTLTQEKVSAALAGQGRVLGGLSIKNTSGILFLLQGPSEGDGEPSVLVTKRSPWIPHPGDLCFPGGRSRIPMDRILGDLWRLPGSPLLRSCGWKVNKGNGRDWQRRVSLFWACSLREARQEIGLKSRKVAFLGILPPLHFELVGRSIVPIVGWISEQRRFPPNLEVERILSIPLSSLLNPNNHAAYRPASAGDYHPAFRERSDPFPCFVHADERGTEILWGATYHIATSFLKRVLDFDPPPMDGRRTVPQIWKPGMQH